MESIFHEKQEGCLCAQHCLNALLQSSYYNAVDLGDLAEQMDEEERLRMAESGLDSDEYKQFMQQPSENMDDSGYFSVQVISSALKVLGLELIPYSSTEPTALIAQKDPSLMQAYICNYKGHWFTIRKIAKQWFNLNSLLDGPQLLSETYLAMFFVQLIQEGYSIFIVIGQLPECLAEKVLLKNPVTVSPQSSSSSSSTTNKQNIKEFNSVGHRLGTAAENNIKLSEIDNIQVPSSSKINNNKRERIIPITIQDDDDDDENLKKALQLSLTDTLTIDSINNIIDESQMMYDVQDDNNYDDADDNDDELKKALKMSLECDNVPSTPDPDDIRLKRLAYLGISHVN